jgi:hypothetical protein
VNRDSDNSAIVEALLAANPGAVVLDDPNKPAEPTGGRMTKLGQRVLEMQRANAERITHSDDFGFPEQDEVAPDANPQITSEPVPERPKVVAVFNVGKGYTIAPPTEPGKPKPIVRKINNKFARRILRKRGLESRVERTLREAGAQYVDARRVTDSAHEAHDLVRAQRDYQREQTNLEQATSDK